MSEADHILARFMEDDEFYCLRNLKIRDKNGKVLPFEWSMRLVMDVALGTTTESILQAHDLQHHQFEKILENPQFVMQVADLRTQLEKDGATFKLKAQLQADFYLTKVHEMIMDTDTDEKVKTRLIEDVVRWGGLDAPQPIGTGGMGAGPSITTALTIEVSDMQLRVVS